MPVRKKWTKEHYPRGPKLNEGLHRKTGAVEARQDLVISCINAAPGYTFKTTSIKNSVSLLENRADPPYFSATAAMEGSPIPRPLRRVE